ncbi:MAG: ABC transporter substrate-binding protein [Chloroflexales bacterium]|nr:ABC transporter substrate-binding protein [Chloroflexales bacterium]
MTRNDTLTTLDGTTTDVLDLAGVDRAALECLDLDTISISDLAAWLRDHGAAHLSAIERIELAVRLITRRRFLIGAGALGLGVITGCGAQEEAAAPTATVERTGLNGDVSVDTDTRVLATGPSTLGYLLELGVAPVAAGAYDPEFFAPDTRFHPALRPLGADDVQPFTWAEPNLEIITALDPDLVIGSDFEVERTAGAWDRLPDVRIETYALNPADPRADLRAIAAIVGREQAAEEIINRFNARIERLSARVAPPVTSLDIIRPYRDQFGVHLGGFAVEQLRAIGYAIPLIETVAPDKNSFGTVMSYELLGLLEADALVLTARREGGFDAESIAAFESNPLYSRIPAVQAGRVVEVDNFALFGLVGLTAIGDALESLVDDLAALD